MSNPFEEITSRLDHLERLLQEIKSQGNQFDEPDEEQILCIEETSNFLHLTVPSIYGLVHRSIIPHMKKGKRLYFSKKELIEWIKKGHRKTAGEIAEEAEKYISGKRKGGKR